ncbi:MAG: membrane dipeptidase, partial [Chitinophagaceae bacterium]
KLHKEAVIIDTHGDILHDQIKTGADLGKRQSNGHFDLVRAKEGGLDVQVFAVWSDETGNFAMANRQIDSLTALIARNPGRMKLVKDAASLQKAVSEGALAAMIGVEGGHMIDEDLNKLEALAKRGMAYLTLTWNNSTSWASSAADETAGKIALPGLNDFGRKVIYKLNDLGVLVDLSHVGEKTFYDALAATKRPVLVSHSSVHAIAPVPRNLKDEQIRAIGKNGGVISLNFYSGFIDPAYAKRQKDFFAKYAEELRALTSQFDRNRAIDTLMSRHPSEAESIRPSLSLLIDHVDHIVKLIGTDHVGIGADFDGAESFPQGLNSVADFPKITGALIERGYSDADITKILGGNFIRLLKANKGR